MSDTEARIGYGLALEIALASAPSVFTYIREVFDATPPTITDETKEATHFQSPHRFKEHIPGLSDGGEASFPMNYIPGSATDIYINSLRGQKLIARMTYADGIQVLFKCTRSSYEPTAPIDDRKTAALKLKVSSVPHMSTSPVAPRNLVAPTIEGTAQVGQLLIADPGAWAGALDFAYQWQADTEGNGTFADISGATGSTYVLAAGQLGDDVRVEVTASNSAFETVVNSAETVAVIAA